MSKASEYLCTENVVGLMEGANLSLHGLRLLHALCYFADEVPGGMIKMGFPAGRPVIVRTNQILNVVGPDGANDLDTVHAGYVELSKSGMFDVLKRDGNGRLLEYKFNKRTAELAHRYKKDKFAMVDMVELRKCRTVHQMLFYTRLLVHMNADFPVFLLPGVDPDKAPWNTSTRRKWLGAAKKWSVELGLPFMFVPMPERRTDRIQAVKVKVSHPESAWSEGALYSRKMRRLPTLVVGGEVINISRAQLNERENWRWIDAESPRAA